MGSFHNKFHYKWGAFIMNFTTNGDQWLEILLQWKSLCRKFYSVQRDLWNFSGCVGKFTTVVTGAIVLLNLWSENVEKYDWLPQFSYEWIGFTTVDNLLFFPVTYLCRRPWSHLVLWFQHTWVKFIPSLIFLRDPYLPWQSYLVVSRGHIQWRSQNRIVARAQVGHIYGAAQHAKVSVRKHALLGGSGGMPPPKF